MRVKEFATFIKRRDAHRIHHDTGKWPSGFKPDPIISKYRFCNVDRNMDRVTRWLRENWYPIWDEDPFAGEETHQDIWFAAVVARLLNLPESLHDVRNCIIPWKPEKFRSILHARKAQGLKNFNPAYIVSTNGVQIEKVDYLVARVLGPLWAARKKLRFDYETLDSWCEALMEFDGLGSFIAAQVVADVKIYHPFASASDFVTFAMSGPGSRRGLNRVMGRGVKAPLREWEWKDTLLELRDATLPLLPRPIHALDAQNIQNCLCEFDKYERARLGEGTPKQIYKKEKNR